MITNAKKVLAGIATLAALALGGSAIAGAAGGDSPQADNDAAAQAAACNAAGIDAGGNVEYDEETGTCTLDSGGSDESEVGDDESAEEGKEVPEDDGPGGHADEPQNPNADHQFEGKE